MKILIADDHPIVRQGLAEMIDQQTDVCVCGTAEDVHKAARQAGIRFTPKALFQCQTVQELARVSEIDVAGFAADHLLYEGDRVVAIQMWDREAGQRRDTAWQDVERWRTGFVTDAVAEDLQDFDGWKAYVAGPPPLVEAAMQISTARGLRSEDLHADVFFTPGEASGP